ncbi:hypothetical protein EG68_00975 [Paragonimus skrjabini miyazakii]|uniref:Cadherin domain-containing protein n=1 Tax=Paragonimus skrjabini miyazakii TaxID=59628 RepID=A0A8S9Z2X6_9TREM|nr:hypothetical protein EG68_00975 [Paragonimus skrjabini miyazakii]
MLCTTLFVESEKITRLLNYTISEDSPTPTILGNLVMDLNLTDWMLKQDSNLQSRKHNQSGTTTTTTQLSIDRIANAGKHTAANDLLSPENIGLRLFPSNQWGNQYFAIRHSSLSVQQLIMYKRIDRDTVCLPQDASNVSSGGCICLTGQCTGNQHAPYCEFILTIALYPMQMGMDLFLVRIMLQDVNDNSPVFQTYSKEYKLVFKETDHPGAFQRLPIATDVDMCFNGQVHYDLQRLSIAEQQTSLQELFELRLADPSMLELILNGPLDREQTDHYRLYVLAYDTPIIGVKHTTTLTITVEVEDANDCYPTFLLEHSASASKPACVPPGVTRDPALQTRLVSLSEDIPQDSIFLTVKATDADAGVNGNITYSFSRRVHPWTQKSFAIDIHTGELRTKRQLDRERTPVHNGLHQLIVLAQDHGIPPRSSSLLVLVRLLDMNDNSPRIRLVDEKFPSNINQSWIDDLSAQSKMMWSTVNYQFSKQIRTKKARQLDLIGTQEVGKIVTSITANDPDLDENGTVVCVSENQVMLPQNRQKLTSAVPFKLQPLLMYRDAESAVQCSSHQCQTKKRLDLADFPFRTDSWNAMEGKAYAVETILKLIPGTLSDIFLRIRCHDQGSMPLSSERTLHFRLLDETDIRPQFEHIILLSRALDARCGGRYLNLTNKSPSNNGYRQVNILDNGPYRTVCLTLSVTAQPNEPILQLVARPRKPDYQTNRVQYRLLNKTDPGTVFKLIELTELHLN